MAKGKNVVKSTQGNLKLLFIIVLIIAWAMVIITITGDNSEEEQMKLVRAGELLLEDELYVRAAEKYAKAINDYSTDINDELEEKLLYIYKDGNLKAQYEDLVEQRILDGKAKAEEYIDYCTTLIQKGSIAKAMPLLKKGEEQYDNEELTALYESVKYQRSIRDLVCTTLKTPSSNWLIPAFDGTKWGYVDNRDSVVIEFKYEEAYPFAGDYAVVKIDGGYILIDKSCNKMAIDKVGLDEMVSMAGSKIVGIKDGKYYLFSEYFEPIIVEGHESGFEGIYLNDNGLIVAKSGGKWAIFSSSMEPVTEFIFDDVVVNSRNQVFTKKGAVVKDAGGYYIVNEEGKAYFEKRFQEIKGYEGGLIAAKDESGKWGFIDGTATYIIEPQYEDAMSFSHHLGAVKYAGKWGYINRYNTMIVENDYEEVMPFLSGSALVKDSSGIYSIITLKYHESF